MTNNINNILNITDAFIKITQAEEDLNRLTVEKNQGKLTFDRNVTSKIAIQLDCLKNVNIAVEHAIAIGTANFAPLGESFNDPRLTMIVNKCKGLINGYQALRQGHLVPAHPTNPTAAHGFSALNPAQYFHSTVNLPPVVSGKRPRDKRKTLCDPSQDIAGEKRQATQNLPSISQQQATIVNMLPPPIQTTTSSETATVPLPEQQQPNSITVSTTDNPGKSYADRVKELYEIRKKELKRKKHPEKHICVAWNNWGVGEENLYNIFIKFSNDPTFKEFYQKVLEIIPKDRIDSFNLLNENEKTKLKSYLRQYLTTHYKSLIVDFNLIAPSTKSQTKRFPLQPATASPALSEYRARVNEICDLRIKQIALKENNCHGCAALAGIDTNVGNELNDIPLKKIFETFTNFPTRNEFFDRLKKTYDKISDDDKIVIKNYLINHYSLLIKNEKGKPSPKAIPHTSHISNNQPVQWVFTKHSKK